MITEFATYLRVVKGYSDNTVEAYVKDLRHFVRWYRVHMPNAHWRQITRRDIDDYMMAMSSMSLSPATINRHLASLSGLFKFQKREGLRDDNPCQYETRAKLMKKIPNTIPVVDIEKAICHADEHVAMALRLFLSTGCRIQELLDMNISDIDFDNNRILVLGKGSKERYVYFDNDCRDALIEYTAGRIGRIFERWTQRDLRYEVYDALRPFSSARQLSPHAIRHTYTTELARHGCPTTSLKVLLGHESLQTTQRYVDFALCEAQADYFKFHS